ncbi:hypothetical protein V8D89_008703 [Ganoderma adspersum]
MSVGTRCFQCKEELRGSGTGQRHATLTGHTWQPGYHCTSCEALFSKHIECEQHIHQFGGRCRRAPTKSSTPPVHTSSSSSASGWSPLMLGGRGSIGVTTPRSGVSSPLLRCTMCRPPVVFGSQESLNNHSKGMSACAKCHLHFRDREILLEHYSTSPSRVHPKCSDCGTGVLGDFELKAHETRCARRASAQALIPNSGVESTQSKVTTGPSLDEGLAMGVSVPPAGESGQDVTDMAAILLGSSGLGSDFSSLEPSPTVTAKRDVDDTEIDVPGTIFTHQPPLIQHLEDSDVGVSQVDVTLPPVDMVCFSSFAGDTFVTDLLQCDPSRQGEDEELSSDEVGARTVTSGPLEGAHRTGAESLSLHCRSCFTDPCVKPVATLCGHIFCHSCIVRQLATTMCCSVCQRPSLIRLHMGTDY